jgi:hypothetical protein
MRTPLAPRQCCAIGWGEQWRGYFIWLMATAFSEHAVIELRQVNQDRNNYLFPRSGSPAGFFSAGDVSSALG